MQKKKPVEGEANVRYTYVYKTFFFKFSSTKEKEEIFPNQTK